MTSPLSTLRKNRRAPLPQSHGERVRRVPLESSDAEYEASLLKELFPMRQSGSGVTGGLNTLRSKVTPRRSPKEEPPPTDFELMSSMMKKIVQLERKVTSQVLDIEKKNKRITVLEEKLQLLHEHREREKQDEGDLDRKCRRLQQQVWEMEKFLSDYGMIWVGDGERDDTDDEAETQQTPEPAGVSRIRKVSVNFDLLLQNVRDLNLLAGEGGTRITYIPGGAKLTQQPTAHLQLYRNGMKICNGPFTEYTHTHTQSFIQDLMDGFLPSELQNRFPHGVLIQVTDRREEEFKGEFPGKGQTVGGSEQEVQRYRQETSETLSLRHNHEPDRKLSMQQFLNKLPECVVKEGNVINIRSSLKHHLQGCGGAVSCVPSVIDTPALHTLRERPECDEAAQISTLRVKSENGEKTFILKMFFSETIGHLRRYLDAHRGFTEPPYDIISAFPHLCYHRDDNQTLLQGALTPNAALLLRLRPPVTS